LAAPVGGLSGPGPKKCGVEVGRAQGAEPGDKDLFDVGGHRSLFERPDLFNEVMTTTVLPQT
jgi:hypothetical protein